MMTLFQGDKAYLAVDNLPHSWVSEKHLIAWRMCLLLFRYAVTSKWCLDLAVIYTF